MLLLFSNVGPYLHGNMYEDRGEMVSTIIVCFALSSAIAGYASGSYYRYSMVASIHGRLMLFISDSVRIKIG